MSNISSLQPFKKGEDPRRNTTGENKGHRSLKTLLQEALVKVGEGNAEPYDVLLIKRVMKMAIADGNEAMIRLVWGYLEGLPVAKSEITGKDGEALIASHEIKEITKKLNELYGGKGN